MAELDDAYANGAYIPDADRFMDRWPRRAAEFRKTANAEPAIPYGSGEREKFDLFRPAADAAGCMIFVHGGYWKALHRSDWSHLAAGALQRGWAVAMPSYDLCPAVGISDITRQIQAAVIEIAVRIDGPISLVGHSAGGHLVARMLDPDLLPDNVADRIVACVPVSPLADLEPLLRTSMNEDFGLTVQQARAESPIYQPVPEVPVTVWVGGHERPAFLDQARWLSDAWGCDHVVAAGKHHFDVIDALEDADSDMIACLTP